MNNTRLYVDLHVLQTVPPSCVNRDDTGSPKTAVYGGATRARVSSQAWKRAMRLYFRQLFAEEDIGVRTKKVADMVAAEIAAIAPAADARKLAVEALGQANVKLDAKSDESGALFFMSQAQAKALARLAAEGCKDKKLYQQAAKSGPSYDMALFGRMVASDPSLNYDAAAQVAHSISTHAVHNEYDYFTAVDDCETVGAGHLGTVEFNSATLYRYATVNVRELAALLGADAASVVRGFAEAFLCSMPTGKQNTFANRTRPDAVYITVRTDQPVNLCGAFEKPVRGQDGYVDVSIERLAAYAGETYRSGYVDKPALALAIHEKLAPLATVLPLPALLDTLERDLQARLAAGTGE